MKFDNCSKEHFGEPSCEAKGYSLIYHVQTQSCICRETRKRKAICSNNGLLVIDDQKNSTECS